MGHLKRGLNLKRGLKGTGLGAWLGVSALIAGCAAAPPSDQREARLADNLSVYDMYDNSRDWGPSFLIGPPSHHWGDETRIDDTRAVPRVDSQEGTGAADPATPPNLQDPQPTFMARPLPPLP